MRILAIRFGRVGDVILVWRAAGAVAAAGHEITLVTDRRMEGLFEGDGVFRRVVGWDRGGWKRAGAWGGVKGLFRAVADLRHGEWDVVAEFQGFPETALLASLVPAGRRALRGEITPTPVWHHDVEDHLALWKHLELPSTLGNQPLRLSEGMKTWAEEYWKKAGWGNRKVLAVNPGASAEYKRWPSAWFGEAVKRVCRKTDCVPLVLWGPGEEALAQEVVKHLDGRATVAEPTSLPQLAALLSRCSVLLTNDSGPMHLAAAVGIPVAAVFFKEHSRPEVSGPVGVPHRVWWVAREESNQADQVTQHVEELLGL